MNDRETGAAAGRTSKLSAAIRDVRIASAERDDVVVEMREAARMRLELLAQELEPVFSDVPADEIMFDFAISSGLQPRLWIDAVSHVAMGRDRRTYRFIRDTRLGRTVLAESTEIGPVADQVTRYIAERMIERQRSLDGAVESLLAPPARNGASKETIEHKPDSQAVENAAPPTSAEKPKPPRSLLSAAPAEVQQQAPETTAKRAKAPNALRSFLSGLSIVLVGAAAGLAILAAVYWDRVAAYVAAN